MEEWGAVEIQENKNAREVQPQPRHIAERRHAAILLVDLFTFVSKQQQTCLESFIDMPSLLYKRSTTTIARSWMPFFPV